MKKRGDLSLSFGMIFSIILIITFLVAGFYAITKFIGFQQTIQTEQFLNDLQNDINKMWKSPQGSQTIVYSLPTKITSVCFEDDEFQNLNFISKEILAGKKIENIDIAKTIQEEDPFCIPNIKGKLSLRLVKDYGETLVTIER